MKTYLKVLSLHQALLFMASLCEAVPWRLERSTATGENGPIDVTTLTVSEKDHGEQVDLRISCHAGRPVSAGLRLSKAVEAEDVIQTSSARYASVLIHFPKEREAKVMLRATLSDRWLEFDDSSSAAPVDPEAEPFTSERWSVERFVRQLAAHKKVTIRVSIEGSQDFQEGFNIEGFKDVATPLVPQCPSLGDWIR